MTANLYNQLTSNSNKGMVWKLLCDNRSFEGIPSDKSNLIKEIFDKKINLLAEQINESTDNLIILNKKVISDMITTVNKYKTVKQPLSTSISTSSQSVPEIYNASALSEQRQQKFQDELNKKQTEFENLTQVKIPEKPDFSDNLDTPIGSEMDSMVAKQIAMREEQLNGVLNRQNTEEAKKWLELSNTNVSTLDNDANIKLKIGDDINVDLNSSISGSNGNSPKKQVSFSDHSLTEPQQIVDPDNFMELLKKKPASSVTETNRITDTINGNNNRNNNDIIMILREILDKQNQILTLLQK